MNSVVRQLCEQNTDIVMVDTGNSYEGLCEYVGDTDAGSSCYRNTQDQCWQA